MPTIFATADELRARIGEPLGHSRWHAITQEQINLFADAIGDHQWIHVDVEAAKNGPFGTTIAHGLLTMSLGGLLAPDVYLIKNARNVINYGSNRVRFPNVVPVDSRVRLGATILDVGDVEGGVQLTVRLVFELEGATKPACVAEMVSRYYW
jgi:acyl dehydratase